MWVNFSFCKKWIHMAGHAIALLLCMTATAIPSTASSETLKDAVMMALSKNPQVLAAQAQERGGQSDVKVARAAFLPSLDVEVSGGPERTNDPSILPSKLTARSVKFTAAYTIYDGNATKAEVGRQQARLALLTARKTETRERIAANTVDVYINYLRAARLLALAKENLTIHKNVADKMVVLVQFDVGRRFELDQAQARLAQAEANVSAHEVDLSTSEERFRQVVGSRPVSPEELTAPVLPVDLEEALANAASVNPTLMASEAEIRAALETARAARSGLMPHVQAVLTSRRGADLSGIAGSYNDRALMLTANWNLFRGGGDVARQRSAAEGVTAAKELRDDVVRIIEARLGVAWHSMRGFMKSNALHGTAVKHSTMAFAAYEEQFRIGRRSVIDVLNAQSELISARSALVSGWYDQIQAAYQVLGASGDMIPVLMN